MRRLTLFGGNLWGAAAAVAVVLAVGVPMAFGEAAASAAGTGTVVAWGLNYDGELGNGTTTKSDVPVAVSGLSGVTAISAGEEDSLALLSNGTVMAWGDNQQGELGIGTTTDSDVPVAVCAEAATPSCSEGKGNVLKEVTAISANGSHGLALLKDGTVVAWGTDGYGELGNGDTTNSDVPVAVSLPLGVKATAVSAGVEFSMALVENETTHEKTVMTWGDNQHGQLGDGTMTNSDVPVAVSGLSGVTAISAGGSHGLALLESGMVMAWGENYEGQLGNATDTESDVPEAVCVVGGTAPCAQHLSSVTGVAAGLFHSLALLENGTVMAWGENSHGELGDATVSGPERCFFGPCSETPVAVSGLSGVTTFSAGNAHSLALLEDETVMAWGDAPGDGSESPSDVPVAVCAVGETAPCAQHLGGVSAVSAGASHSLALVSGAAPTVTCSAAGSTLSIATKGSATPTEPVIVTASEGNYVVSLGGVTQCTGTSYSVSTYTTVAGPSSGSVTFAPGTATGLTFTGASGAANTLDLVGAPTGLSVVAMNGDTSGSPGQLTITPAGGSPGSDGFSNVTIVDGAPSGSTTFEPGTTSGVAFTGGAGATNLVDLRGEPSGVFTVSVNADTPGSPGDLTITPAGGSPGIDSFSNVTIVDGATNGPTTFQSGTASGVLFNGSEGVANTLDLTGEPPGSFMISVNSDTLGSPGDLTITPNGESPSDDSFVNITAIDGPSSGTATFQPGAASGLTFIGGAGATNLVDLRGEPSGVFTVSVNADMPGSPGDLTITPAGGSPGIDSFSNVTIVDGATNGPTTFQPDPNLLPSSLVGAPPPLVLFVGNDPTSGGSVIDLGPFASPDSMGEQVTGLTVALNGDNAGGPGQVQADVMGTPVGFADFYGVNTVIGSSSLPTTLLPGSATGVTLINVTPAGQAVAFTSTPPSPATVGGSYAVSATGGGSGNSVMFSIDTSKTTAGACSSSGANGANISFAGTGACVIDANQAGSSEYQPALQVQQTITVTNPLQGTPPSAPTITSVTSGGGSSSTGSTASVLTPAQIAALTKLIEGEITPSGKNVTITALLKSGVVSISFTVLQAGTAVIDWYEIPSGAHLAKKTKPKPVLVASGQQSFSTAGTATIKIKLTATGKRRLKHAKRLKLTAEGTFTPTGETPVSATKAFVLER